MELCFFNRFRVLLAFLPTFWARTWTLGRCMWDPLVAAPPPPILESYFSHGRQAPSPFLVFLFYWSRTPSNDSRPEGTCTFYASLRLLPPLLPFHFNVVRYPKITYHGAVFENLLVTFSPQPPFSHELLPYCRNHRVQTYATTIGRIFLFSWILPFQPPLLFCYLSFPPSLLSSCPTRIVLPFPFWWKENFVSLWKFLQVPLQPLSLPFPSFCVPKTPDTTTPAIAVKCTLHLVDPPPLQHFLSFLRQSVRLSLSFFGAPVWLQSQNVFPYPKNLFFFFGSFFLFSTFFVIIYLLPLSNNHNQPPNSSGHRLLSPFAARPPNDLLLPLNDRKKE